MEKNKLYQALGLRYKKFMKYDVIVLIISWALFFLLSAINNGKNQVFNIITMIMMIIAFVSLIELPTLFVLSKFMLHKGKK
jgi:hypothetical protein